MQRPLTDGQGMTESRGQLLLLLVALCSQQGSVSISRHRRAVHTDWLFVSQDCSEEIHPWG